MFLGHNLKLENQNSNLVNQELAAADSITALMPEVTAGKRGRKIQHDSATGLIIQALKSRRKASQKDLVDMVAKEKGWSRPTTFRAVYVTKKRLIKNGMLKVTQNEIGPDTWEMA